MEKGRDKEKKIGRKDEEVLIHYHPASSCKAMFHIKAEHYIVFASYFQLIPIELCGKTRIHNN